MAESTALLAWWLDEVGPAGWYAGGEALDGETRTRWLDTWQAAQAGGLGQWLTYPKGALAYIILLDQFPRNMFRDDGRAFATDRMALSAAKGAIAKGWDLRIDEPARQFFYLPLMHSEVLSDQDRCVRLILDRLPETGANNLLHARAHRDVIRRFGRFPYRNAALGRVSRADEAAFLAEGGYMSAVAALSDPA